MKQQQNFYVFSDDMALGIYDSDGSVSFKVTFRQNSRIRNALGIQIVYSVGQSRSKVDTVNKFAEKFGKKVSQTAFVVNQTSPEGQQLRQFLLKNLPKHPDRRNDFFIAEQIIPFLNTGSLLIPQQLGLAYLVSQRSKAVNAETSEKDFERCCLHLQATQEEIQQGLAFGKAMMANVHKQLEPFTQTLPTMEMSDDYVYGVHAGDGSFYVGLSWKPTEKNHRLRCEPEWSISGNTKEYCQAFANKFSGNTKPVDADGQIKASVSGIKKCKLIVKFFERAPWMPQYKQEQFQRWKKSIILLQNQEHFTEEGIIRLLDLTYGLAEKGGRKYPKTKYLEWGLLWLNNPTRQKRKPRGKQSDS